MTQETSTPAFLSFDQIMQAADMEPMTLDLPEWGGPISLRPLTAGEAETCVEGATKPDGTFIMSIYAPRVIAASFAQPLLTDAQAQAIYANKRGSVLLKIVQAVNALNGVSSEAAAALDAEFRAIA